MPSDWRRAESTQRPDVRAMMPAIRVNARERKTPLDNTDKRQMVVRAAKRTFRQPTKVTLKQAMDRAYYHSRKLSRLAAPDAMQTLIDIAGDTEEEGRVRVVASLAILDRAGIRPTDFDPDAGANEGFDFNPRDYTPEQLEMLEQALRLMIEKREEKEKVRALRGDSR